MTVAVEVAIEQASNCKSFASKKDEFREKFVFFISRLVLFNLFLKKKILILK